MMSSTSTSSSSSTRRERIGGLDFSRIRHVTKRYGSPLDVSTITIARKRARHHYGGGVIRTSGRDDGVHSSMNVGDVIRLDAGLMRYGMSGLRPIYDVAVDVDGDNDDDHDHDDGNYDGDDIYHNTSDTTLSSSSSIRNANARIVVDRIVVNLAATQLDTFTLLAPGPLELLFAVRTNLEESNPWIVNDGSRLASMMLRASRLAEAVLAVGPFALNAILMRLQSEWYARDAAACQHVTADILWDGLSDDNMHSSLFAFPELNLYDGFALDGVIVACQSSSPNITAATVVPHGHVHVTNLWGEANLDVGGQLFLLLMPCRRTDLQLVHDTESGRVLANYMLPARQHGGVQQYTVAIPDDHSTAPPFRPFQLVPLVVPVGATPTQILLQMGYAKEALSGIRFLFVGTIFSTQRQSHIARPLQRDDPSKLEPYTLRPLQDATPSSLSSSTRHGDTLIIIAETDNGLYYQETMSHTRS